MFEIAWFNADKATEAMQCLAQLSNDELNARGKTHHYRMWNNVKSPSAEHTPSGKRWQYCVATDYRGSVQLNPDARQLNPDKMLIIDFVDKIEDRSGYLAARIKPETWTLPEFVAEAASELKREKDFVKIIEAERQQTIDAQGQRLQYATRAYFETCATMCGVSEEKAAKLSMERLGHIYTMAMIKLEVARLDEWLAIECPEAQQTPENDKPYDPMTFLEHAQKVMGQFVSNTSTTRKAS